MTSQNIWPLVFAAIGFVAGKVLELILERVLTPYIPERKKLISYIKKFLFFHIQICRPNTFNYSIDDNRKSS